MDEEFSLLPMHSKNVQFLVFLADTITTLHLSHSSLTEFGNATIEKTETYIDAAQIGKPEAGGDQALNQKRSKQYA